MAKDFISDDEMNSIASDDPQADRAAQGFKQLGQAALESQPVQNALTGQGLRSYDDMVTAAVAGDPAAREALAAHNANVAIGSIKLSGPSKPIYTTEEALASETAPGIIQNTPATGPLTSAEMIAAQNKKNFELLKAERLAQQTAARKRKFADGGPVESPDFIPDEQFNQLTAQQPQQPAGINHTPDFIPDDQFKSDEDLKEEKYGSPLEMAKAGLEGFAQGVAGPLAPMAERALGVNPEDIRGREETNPITHYASEAAGLIGPAFATSGASLAAKAGMTGVAEAIPTLAKMSQLGALDAIQAKLALTAGETLASKVGVTAAKAAIDNVLIASGDEVSKLIKEDPNQSSQTAIANIGLAGVLGGALGGSLGAAGALWESAVGSKTSKLLEDFKGRISEHLENPDPVSAVTDELKAYHGDLRGISDEVYGPSGLKAQDIGKAMPAEMNEKITGQASGIYDTLKSSVDKMIKNQDSYPPRLIKKLQEDMESFGNKLSQENSTPGSVFNAVQDLKQTLQGYSKFDKFVKPVDEAYDFVREAKSLSKDLRVALEDKSVWGKAAERQQAINSAFSDYLPSLKDFEKKFTSEIAGVREIDPGKVNTYMNQLGKPNAELKQEMLKNFLDASEKYKKVIDQTHTNLGLESPIKDSPMNVTLSTLGKKTTGSRLADIFISKGLGDAGGKALGAGIGAGIGHGLGLSKELGAIAGAHALGPFFNSILPAIAKGILEHPTSALGMKSAVEYATAVSKGEALMNKAAINVFNLDKEVLPDHAMPTENDRMKLNKMLKVARTDPEGMMSQVNHVQKYLPDNAMALDQTKGNAVAYLNGLRPDLDKKAPLDSKPVASKVQEGAYQQALNIAQQPLLVLDKIKKGTVTQQDIVHLSSLYPQLYGRIKNKLTDSMVSHLDKGKVIPYKTRIGLSVFMAQPLDSTMTPTSIQAAQVGNMRAPANDQQQASPGVKSSPALQKMPGMYQTPSQSREAQRVKH